MRRPVRESKHDLKYALAYVVSGVCVLRYDNEPGKGDHRHLGALEMRYEFTMPESCSQISGATWTMEARMKTVTLSVASRADVTRRAIAALSDRRDRFSPMTPSTWISP